jgi:transcriptional regulator with XRE-family HTH domain
VQTSSTPPLRTLREAKGLSLQQVADAAGVNIGHLSRIERGQTGLSVEVLARLAAVLELRELTKFLAPYRRAKGGDGAMTRSAQAVKPGRKTKT